MWCITGSFHLSFGIRVDKPGCCSVVNIAGVLHQECLGQTVI